MPKRKQRRQPTPQRTSWVDRLKALKDGLVMIDLLMKVWGFLADLLT